jgi:hypothetical protein
MEVILWWAVGDEEEWNANEMDEHAQQDLETVQSKDGVANFLFDGTRLESA